jgi:hypothetical protein
VSWCCAAVLDLYPNRGNHGHTTWGLLRTPRLLVMSTKVQQLPLFMLMSTMHEVGQHPGAVKSAHGLTNAASSAPAAPAAVRKSLSCNALVSSATRLRLCLARACRQCADM